MLSRSIGTKEASSSFYKEFPLKILIYLVLNIIPKDRTSKSLEYENKRHQRANNIFHSHLLRETLGRLTRTYILLSLVITPLWSKTCRSRRRQLVILIVATYTRRPEIVHAVIHLFIIELYHYTSLV